MRIDPATIDQVRIASDGRMVTVTADAGGVADSIRRLDACLRLRYSESADCWIVYRVHRHGQPCRDDDPERVEELVLTAQQCDHRIVARLQYIDSHGRSGYDYAAEVERAAVEAHRAQRYAFAERVGDGAERTAHALRKDLGERYRGRAFVPRNLSDGSS